LEIIGFIANNFPFNPLLQSPATDQSLLFPLVILIAVIFPLLLIIKYTIEAYVPLNP